MTGIRQSHVFALQSTFKGGKPKGAKWIVTPPGSYIQHTHTREAERINSTGSKFFDTYAYGKLTGTWDWSFSLDYNYLEPLLLAFDYYECTQDTTTGRYTHVFEKRNASRNRSFTIRTKILHGIAGNDDKYPDEISILKGCVCQKIAFSEGTTTSMMKVTMSGFYCDEEMIRCKLDDTDYQPYDCVDGLTEYFCMFTDAVCAKNYVANTTSLGVVIGSAVNPIYTTCSPFPSQFYEATSSFQFNTSCYANDPKKYKERVFRGGRSSETAWKERTETTTTEIDIGDTEKIKGGYVKHPQSKGMAPIDDLFLVSYSKSVHDDPSTYPVTDVKDGLKKAIDDSERMFEMHVTKCVMKSASWQKGDDSQLYDQLSSTECRRVDFTVRNSSMKMTTSHESTTEDPETYTYIQTHALTDSGYSNKKEEYSTDYMSKHTDVTIELYPNKAYDANKVANLEQGYINNTRDGHTVPGVTFESHIMDKKYVLMYSGTPVSPTKEEKTKVYYIPYTRLVRGDGNRFIKAVVNYVEPKKLTVKYVYAVSGETAHASVEKDVLPETTYSVESPEIEGYVPDLEVVTGVMPSKDLTVTVTYTAVSP